MSSQNKYTNIKTKRYNLVLVLIFIYFIQYSDFLYGIFVEGFRCFKLQILSFVYAIVQFSLRLFGKFLVSL